VVSEAVRTNLGQSRAITILSQSSIGAALRRMQRPLTSRLDLPLAREIAAREGVKAIVDGAVRPIGGGYIISLRLVSADSANELAAFQETASGPRELLESIDDLTRKLRGKIGESLKEVRDAPPLEQVTTPSLDALRKYADAQRQLDLLGDAIRATDLLREAVKIDTAFAMAWRKLGVALNNSGRPRMQIDSTLERAYRFRDRLTERERLLAEATYFHLGPGRDRRKAIEAYQGVLQLDQADLAAANNLGNIYSGRREFARAESLYKRIIAAGRASQQHYTNLVPVLFNQGKQQEAERVLAEMRDRFPTVVSATLGRASFYYHRGQLDSMEAVYKEVAARDNIGPKIQGRAGLITLALMRGRVTEMTRHMREIQALQTTLGTPQFPINDSLSASMTDLYYYDDTVRAVRRVEATVAKTNIAAMPQGSRPYGGLASFFARAGQPARARAYLAQDEADVRDSTMRRIREPGRHGLLGTILLSEGRPRDALWEFWKSDTTYDGPNGNCAICVYDDIGLAWKQAGVVDSAIYYWEKYLATPYYGREGFDASQAALMHKWLGELYEGKGDASNAARHYKEFVQRWEQADARLQPKVAEVRRKLSRLADVERK
jgi:tetratricopeptide (TPR) repeat protein